MPELPEVQVVKNFFDLQVVGKRILRVYIINKKLRYQIPPRLNSKLSNLIISEILRRGKYLILLFKNSDISLLIHLGMTGYFRLNSFFKPEKHDHIVFQLTNEYLIFNDIRKFGFIKIYSAKNIFNCSHLKKIGIEPLSEELNFKYFRDNCQRDIDLKTLLMDQSFLAGLGNIYCSEILFDARLDPRKKSNSLLISEIKNLIESIKKILNKSIIHGGTTIKNFIVSNEKIGYFKNELKVYGRDNKSCFRCSGNEIIEKIKQKGRSTFFCKKCQK